MTGHRAAAWLRGLSALLAGGLVALVLALVVAWIVAERTGAPGPGTNTLIWHAAGAVAAVVVQRQADRRPGAAGVLAACGVVVITAVVLAVQWLA